MIGHHHHRGRKKAASLDRSAGGSAELRYSGSSVNSSR
jgi:hypothetical protein